MAECDLIDSSDTIAEKIDNVVEPVSVKSTFFFFFIIF